MTKSHVSSSSINAKKQRFLFLLAALICSSLLVAGLLTTLNPAQPALAATGPVCYVNTAAGGANSGESWNDAYTDLQSAMTDANCTEIWVATGVYTPGLSQSDAFTLTSGGQLYGGFAATETVRTERDWEANPTILSGDINGDDTTDANGVVTDTANINGSNSYHVVYADGASGTVITGTTVLDGFTITAGQANGGGDDSYGGGFYCDGSGSGNNCSPTLSNLTFAGNVADGGGAMHNGGYSDGSSSPSLSNVTFSGNAAVAGDGGAMYNSASDGGVSSPTLLEVTFSDNTAESGGAMYNYAHNGVSSPVLTDVIFSANTAIDDGGAMNNHSSSNGTVSPVLYRVIFTANRASSGGAIYSWGRGGEASPVFYNVSFLGNMAEGSAGGALGQVSSLGGTSNPQLTNVLFSGNIAANRGGGLYNYSIDFSSKSNPSLVNVTFVNNSAQEGGAIYSRDNGGTVIPSLTNVILWGNTATSDGSQIFDNNTTSVISYSLVQGGDSGSNTGTAFSDGTGNIDADPLFVNALGTDGISGTLDDDLSLGDFSPAIDAGDNDTISETTDLDGNARFYDDTDVADTGNGTAPIVDLGAYERQSNSCTNIVSPIYVDRDATTGNNDGTSWADAFTDLQDGLTLARTCAITETWVATGIYTPGLSANDTFNLAPGVQLYGGFAATETIRSQRNYTTNLTILSGDIGGDDITDANGVVTTTAHISGSNSHHVVYADGSQGTIITDSTVLDGFTITAGQANGGGINYYGGGFYCRGRASGSECSPSLSNLVFSGNYAVGNGGAMYNDAVLLGRSFPSLSHVTFSGNATTSNNDGGAIYNDGRISGIHGLNLSDVTFSNNTAENGGAIYVIVDYGETHLNLNNVTFSDNAASRSGGALYTEIGSYGSSTSLNDVTFANNSASRDGGAMFSEGYGGNNSPTLNNVIFFNNSASRHGGAMYNSGYGGESSPTLNNVTFAGNWASQKGGAIYNFGFIGDSHPNLINVVFSGNSASDGGAMFNDGNDYGGNSSPTLNHVTFSGNVASGDGGAMYNYGPGGDSSPNLSNVIIWGNQAAISGTQIYNNSATPVISYTLIQSDSNAIVNAGTGAITYGPNILTGDPLFADALGTDGISGTLDDDLRLLPKSPAIDSGDNSVVNETTDLDGNPRFFDDVGVADTGNGTAPIVDMGAYERQSNSSPDITLTGNGQVISSGDSTPDTADDSDFGSVTLGQVVTHTFTISNDGTVDLTLTGTPAITLTNGSAFTVTQPASTTLAVGEATTFTLTFAPQSAGAFTDTVTIASDDPDESPYTFMVSGTGADHTTFLPIIFKNDSTPAAAPDLVVDSLAASGDAITVTIRNDGAATADDFWVDVYFNPDPAPPGLNQPWDTIAPAGAVWGVTKTLAPNETLVLTVGGDYYFSSLSSSTFPVGAAVYVYVDSINYDTAYGNIQESNEDNNASGPVISKADITGVTGLFFDNNKPVSTEELPDRN